ncbi:hypothetical protein [Streptomyces mobaraensis]|uniref:hypothetical protein n=1 Tax=Streptomyces mobaraensis TaxID=35621 RepID=UPI0033CB9CC7
MSVRSAWLLPTGQTREDTRLAPLGVMAPTGELTSRDGVIAGGQPLAATGAGPMQVQIGVGRAIVQGTTPQGAYPVAITTPETITVPDGHAQHPRIDSIVLRVLDGLYDTSEQTTALVDLVGGEPSPTPTAPTLTGAALRLWDIAVPAGASAGLGGLDWSRALSDRRRFTAAYGGIVPRGGATSDGAYDGQYRDGPGGLERWNAAARTWVAVVPTVPWVPVTLASGYQHDGNAHGPVRYRRLTVGGVPYMQWRGGVGWTANTVPGDGYILSTVVPADCRPVRHVSLVAAAGGNPVNVDFQRGGAVRIIAAGGVRTWLSLIGLSYPLDA